jgi:hypothetical protein
VAVVVVSVLLIVVLTFSVPRKEPERKGPAIVTVEIDFKEFGPGQPNVTTYWRLSNRTAPSQGEPEYIVHRAIAEGQVRWSIQVRLDNNTVYDALEKASSVANFTFKSEWYPNFRSHRVNEIAGVRDGTDNRFWQYYVNGQYMGTGADQTAVSDGDVVRWEFRQALQ